MTKLKELLMMFYLPMSKHGGKREGAGRPPASDAEKMVTRSVRLPQWMLDQLDEIDGDRSWLIRMAVASFYKLKPPAEMQEKFWAEWREKYGKEPPR